MTKAEVVFIKIGGLGNIAKSLSKKVKPVKSVKGLKQIKPKQVSKAKESPAVQRMIMDTLIARGAL